MAFPVIQSSATTISASYNATNLAINMPASIASGDLLLAVIGAAVGAQANATPNSGGNAGWIAADGTPYLFGNTDKETYVWAKVAAGSDTWTFDKGGDSMALSVIVYRITGWYGTVAGGVAANVIEDFTTDDAPSLTPSWGSADNIWLSALVGSASSPVPSYPTGYGSSQVSIGGDNGVALRLTTAKKTTETAASSEDPGVWNGITGFYRHIATIGVRPAAGSPDVTVSASGSALTSGHGTQVPNFQIGL